MEEKRSHRSSRPRLEKRESDHRRATRQRLKAKPARWSNRPRSFHYRHPGQLTTALTSQVYAILNLWRCKILCLPMKFEFAMPEQTYLDAIRAGLEEEMRRDSSVYIFGEDVALGGPFGVTKGLAEKFGVNRLVNTPISEATVMGIAIGAATAGLRPVVEIMFIDFITLAMDQLVNHAAKLHYMSGGQLKNSAHRARSMRHQRRHGCASFAESRIMARPCSGFESRHAGQSRRREGIAQVSDP